MFFFLAQAPTRSPMYYSNIIFHHVMRLFSLPATANAYCFVSYYLYIIIINSFPSLLVLHSIISCLKMLFPNCPSTSTSFSSRSTRNRLFSCQIYFISLRMVLCACILLFCRLLDAVLVLVLCLLRLANHLQPTRHGSLKANSITENLSSRF